jgi:hypothetical protein
MDNNFESFSEDDCSNRCLKPCEEIFYTTFDLPSNQPHSDYEGRKIIYTNNVYMTFIYFISSIGGLLGLWNNGSNTGRAVWGSSRIARKMRLMSFDSAHQAQ